MNWHYYKCGCGRILKADFYPQVKRSHQLSRQLEQPEIEKILKHIVATMQHENTANKMQLEADLNEKQALVVKLDRKTADLDRLQNRLDTLQKIRYFCFFFLSFYHRSWNFSVQIVARSSPRSSTAAKKN